MTQTVEISLVEILNRLEGKIDNLGGKIDHLSNELNEVKVDVATLKEGQTNLKDTVKGIETRLNTLIAVAFSALLGIIAKLIFLK